MNPFFLESIQNILKKELGLILQCVKHMGSGKKITLPKSVWSAFFKVCNIYNPTELLLHENRLFRKLLNRTGNRVH